MRRRAPQRPRARRRRPADVQGPERPADHAAGTTPPPLLPRRAAPARQRDPRRDEPRRAAAADPRRGQACPRMGAPAALAEAWHHGTVAGTRRQRHPVRGDGQARLPLRHDVVALERRVPAPADRPLRPAGEERLVTGLALTRPVVEVEGGRGRVSIGSLRELWLFRGVLAAFVVRQVKVKYKQAAVGVGWVVIQPLLAAALFAVFLGRISNVPSEGVPYF